MKLKEYDWYKSIIYDNPITKSKILMVADTRKFYEITYKNGRKKLIKILCQELRGVKCVDVLNDYEISICALELWQENKVKETNYISNMYINDIIEED